MTTDGVFTETQCRRLDTDSTQTRGCFSGITTISFQPRLPAVGRSATLGEVEAGLCRRFQDHVHADCLRMVCVMRKLIETEVSQPSSIWLCTDRLFLHQTHSLRTYDHRRNQHCDRCRRALRCLNMPT
ncbi:uncharacterized protein LOC116843776 isoform X4 [Odontomachus brunneus]|nr:uncharacterized protein LOC116843776 isoform X4 [Odontomachus brunneus]